MRPERTPFVDRYLRGARHVRSDGLSVEEARMHHLINAFSFVPSDLAAHGMRLEFGVRQGHSIRALANATRGTWNGFDSWRGLPSEVRRMHGRHSHERLQSLNLTARQRIGWRAGQYSTGGTLPSVPTNVALHSGWFNETLPAFLGGPEGWNMPLAFAHVDCDVYESARPLLDDLHGGVHRE